MKKDENCLLLVSWKEPTKSVEVNTGSTFNIINWFGLNANDSLASSANILANPYGTNFLNPDLRPITGSNALSNISFVDLGVQFSGSFRHWLKNPNCSEEI